MVDVRAVILPGPTLEEPAPDDLEEDVADDGAANNQEYLRNQIIPARLLELDGDWVSARTCGPALSRPTG